MIPHEVYLGLDTVSNPLWLSEPVHVRKTIIGVFLKVREYCAFASKSPHEQCALSANCH